MEQFNKIVVSLKNILKGKNKRKTIENTVIIIIIGIIIIIAGGTIFGKGNAKPANPLVAENTNVEVISNNSGSVDNQEMEKRIEKLLSQIEGAGPVTVMITYVAGKEIVPAVDSKETKNDTQEKDNGGGTRNISEMDKENTLVYEEGQNGTKKPIILKEILPEVKGVVVVAAGAADVQVKEKLTKAVQVLLDVPAHKVQVFEKNK